MRIVLVLLALLITACAQHPKNSTEATVNSSVLTEDLLYRMPVVQVPRVGIVKSIFGPCRLSPANPFQLREVKVGDKVADQNRLLIEIGCSIVVEFGGGVVLNVQSADHSADVVFHVVNP